MSNMQQLLKRCLDLAVSLILLMLASPTLLVTAICIRLSMGSPIFFRQIRPGLNGRPFGILKFRTMRDTRGPDGELLPDEVRLTAVGRVVRRFSLDELPQLWNVVRGEMSLVGPRPLLMEYLERYTPEQARRHEVTPGITGWAQVNGRNAITWREKFQYDVWYVDHASFLLDLRILGMTLVRVIRGSGISNEGFATMPRFMGDKADGV
jgi:sugar transferase EpsL